MAAERVVSVSVRSAVRSASMGPRLNGRGAQENDAEVRVRFQASMGPRLNGRGAPILAKVSVIAWSASMGPRLNGRGAIAY